MRFTHLGCHNEAGILVVSVLKLMLSTANYKGAAAATTSDYYEYYDEYYEDDHFYSSSTEKVKL